MYDPWVVQLPDKYVMYRCQNSAGRDRIWRSESRDGITGWTDDRIVIEGSDGADDDLSCSPGVVVAPNGVWHMYYMVGKPGTPEQMCGPDTGAMWHATSFDGIAWTKLGKVEAVPPSGCSVMEPSPILEGNDNVIGVYFVADYWGVGTRLWRMESDALDGHTFTGLSPAGSVEHTQNARVSKVGGRYYFAYSNRSDGVDTQTDELYLGVNLDAGPLMLRATPGTWYCTFVSPGNYLPGPPARLYFAANHQPRCQPDQDPLTCSEFNNEIGVMILH